MQVCLPQHMDTAVNDMEESRWHSSHAISWIPFQHKDCDVSSCKRRSQPMISGAFHLPHWIASRAIILTLINGPSISVSLTVAHIVPPDSDIFRYIQTGNCSRLQTLLLKGQASPADMIESLYGTLDALLFALNCNQYEICQLLLSWGADPMLKTAPS